MLIVEEHTERANPAQIDSKRRPWPRTRARPSTVWRLAWPVFCLIVVCFFGAQTLRRIVPYVLAGVGDTPTTPLLPDGATGQPDDDSRFAMWVLPVASWSILIGAFAFLLVSPDQACNLIVDGGTDRAANCSGERSSHFMPSVRR